MGTDLFHFLRPEWFLALIPAAFLFWLALRARGSATGGNWGKFVDAHLLRHLAIGGAAARASRLVPAMAAAGRGGRPAAAAGEVATSSGKTTWSDLTIVLSA